MTMKPLTRTRLTARLHAASKRPATVICAPEGFGKTTAVRRFLQEHPAATLELELLREHGSLTSFARGLAETLAPVAPGLPSSFARAMEFAFQSSRVEDELAIWFLGHLDRHASRTILIDDLHHAADERILRLLERLVTDSPPGYRWLIASREMPAPAERWLERDLCARPVDENDLRLTQSEMHEIAASMELSQTQTASLEEMTRGWPLAFSLGASLPRWIDRLHQLRPASAEGVYAFFAEQFFLQCDDRLKELLLDTCVFTTLDRDVIAKSPWRRSWPALRDLAADGRLVSLRRDGSIQLRDLFRTFLEQRLEQETATTVSEACTTAANLLENCGRVADALRLYARAGNDAGVLQLCERYGFALVDEGRLDDLKSALATVAADAADGSAVALAVKGIAEANAARSDIAESWYLHAIDKAQGTVSRAEIAYRYGLELVRQGRLDGIELLEQYVGKTLPVELDASLRSTLATAYVLAERFDDARTMMDTALGLVDPSASKPLQAKIHHHAAWVALFTGQIATARNCATLAVESALECAMYDVAARAYSVLYNISYDVEDSPIATLEILDRILDCGLKAGSEQVRLFALLGSIDIRAEIGDADGLRKIEKILDAHSIDYASRATTEALLPAEALTLAGSGRFGDAYNLIFPTGERQVTADRKALRFSEIAFYASAAGFTEKAKLALAEVENHLRQSDPASRRTIRTQLYYALAVRLLGRIGEAYDMLRLVSEQRDAMSARLRALYACVNAIFDHWESADNYDALYVALHELRAEHFGGVGAALAALPCAQEQMQIAG